MQTDLAQLCQSLLLLCKSEKISFFHDNSSCIILLLQIQILDGSKKFQLIGPGAIHLQYV